MSTPQWSISGRRVVTRKGVGPAVISVADGRIVGVEMRQASEHEATVHVGDCVLMPGLVDTHVHINEPGRTEWEGFATATRAAAAGGVTTVVDMPLNSIPATTSSAGLAAKLAAAEGKCAVDYGLWGGVVPGNLEEIVRLSAAGVLGFKCFLTPSGVEEFENVDEATLRVAMRKIASFGGLLLAHAESPAEIHAAMEHAGHDANPRSYRAYLASRPASAEVSAVAMLVRLMEETGCRVHVVHVSAAEVLEIITAGKRRGLPLTCETCPHYLTLEAEEIPDGATQFKCAPPVRESCNRELLWEGLASGVLDMIVSDHSPCPPELKQSETGSFAEAWGGIASLQFGLPLVWTEARRRGYAEQDVARWMCEAPARLAGLSHRKGAIDVGYDADLVVWDPDASFVVEPDMILHRHTVTPYLGRRLMGVVDRTFVRGVCVYEAGKVPNGAQGRWLRKGEGA